MGVFPLFFWGKHPGVCPSPRSTLGRCLSPGWSQLPSARPPTPRRPRGRSRPRPPAGGEPRGWWRWRKPRGKWPVPFERVKVYEICTYMYVRVCMCISYIFIYRNIIICPRKNPNKKSPPTKHQWTIDPIKLFDGKYETEKEWVWYFKARKLVCFGKADVPVKKRTPMKKLKHTNKLVCDCCVAHTGKDARKTWDSDWMISRPQNLIT